MLGRLESTNRISGPGSGEGQWWLCAKERVVGASGRLLCRVRSVCLVESPDDESPAGRETRRGHGPTCLGLRSPLSKRDLAAAARCCLKTSLRVQKRAAET
jgi:hypothetical protein